MRYNNDGVRVGLLSHESHRKRSHLCLDGARLIVTSRHHREQRRRGRRLLGYDPNEKDCVARQWTSTTSNTGGQTGSLKVLLYGYVHELGWFCTRLNEFLFMFVFQLLYER